MTRKLRNGVDYWSRDVNIEKAYCDRSCHLLPQFGSVLEAVVWEATTRFWVTDDRLRSKGVMWLMCIHAVHSWIFFPISTSYRSHSTSYSRAEEVSLLYGSDSASWSLYESNARSRRYRRISHIIVCMRVYIRVFQTLSKHACMQVRCGAAANSKRGDKMRKCMPTNVGRQWLEKISW